MKRMLVNATQEEELRVALVDGQRIYDLAIEIPSREQKKANIYKGRITRVEASLEACFVDYGADRHGFLPLKEISREYFKPGSNQNNRNIRDLVSEGQEIMVQVEKEERGNKGAALTTFISLAGRFLVLMPNNPRAGGVSRRIEGEDREQLREALDSVQLPEGMGAIVRTAGVGRSAEELQWDVSNLQAVWQAIQDAAAARPSPFLIYQESKPMIRALRDYLADDVGEVLVDSPAVFAEGQDYMQRFMPNSLRKLKLYEDEVPLFTRFQIENQIESAHAHALNLPSGGSIVIDHTEALVSIDINSARATRGGDIETTATNTNLEAADEIARQLRLRDIGGLIVIDFIDMESTKNQRAVEDRLRDAVKQDRARIQIGRISRFGLLELSRQRLRPSIAEATHHACPRCSGMGKIRSVESLALTLLRLIGEEARKDRTAKVIAQLPVDVATFLINEKRDALHELETKTKTDIVLVPNKYIETPAYEIRRLRDDEVHADENRPSSYQLAQQPTVDVDAIANRAEQKPVTQQAAVTTMLPAAPAPLATEPAPAIEAEKVGIFVAMWRFFFGGAGKTEAAEKPAAAAPRRQERNDRSRGRNERGDRYGRGRNRGDNRGENRNDGRDDKRDDKREARRDEARTEPRNESRQEARHEPRRDDHRRDQQAQRQREQQERRRERDAQRAQQTPAPVADATTADAVSTQADAFAAEGQGAHGERRGRRNRRRRGGRGRGGENRGFAAGGDANQGGANGATNPHGADTSSDTHFESHTGGNETRENHAPEQRHEPMHTPSTSHTHTEAPSVSDSWSPPASGSEQNRSE
ncbi:MAG: Rne/Rng family ribonuclease [Steroidobacteraceae bacterium]